MTRYELNDEYFDWLYGLVCANRFPVKISYRKLLMNLHSTEFRYTIPKDQNRAEDGVGLRYRFALRLEPYEDVAEVLDILERPCSLLEMMVGLAIRCESFMDDPNVGDRTGQWFWNMVINLGLGNMTDDRFDRWLFDQSVNRLLNREYEPDGTGGLFRIRNCDRDLRKVEIWHQLCWYLDGIV